jgi:hypothetical protein
MLKWIRGDRNFWSPIIQGWGLVIFFVGMVSMTINKIITPIEWTNFAFGIAFYLLGIFIVVSKDKNFWASVLLRAAIPMFFFGVAFVTICLWGFFIIAFGLLLLFLGIYMAPK